MSTEPVVVKDPPPMRSLYRVTYSSAGQSLTSLVVAFSGAEAAEFLGLSGQTPAISQVGYPVEVVGLDKAHDPVAAPESIIAEPPVPSQLSPAELIKLREILAQH